MRRRFRLPPSARSHPAFGLASAIVHVVVVVGLLVFSGPTFDRAVTWVDLGAPDGTDVRVVELPVAGGGAPRDAAAAGRAGPDTATSERRDVAFVPPAPVPQPAAAPQARQGAEPDAADPPGAGAGPGPDRPRRGRALLGARLGDGRLWIRPSDAIAAAIASALDSAAGDAETHVARLDSAVAARIYAFVDTLVRDSLTTPQPPSWVAEIDGQKWGVDGSWLYLGPLKIPSAVLALLPLPQGNYGQAQQAAALQRIREDIYRAAQRAETAAQFRRYVEETRRRRDAERERERNQRIPPSDSVKT